ncbi:MAG: arylsulfatase, partial [Chthoniobacterales bacterium]|nr:arylsulfatase [Chthoniobacterales bacterium]
MMIAPFASVALAQGAHATSDRPNVVLIYADDVGFGDVGCYGATKIKTPNIDRLAMEGVRFTDAHSPAATCTPSRYALMTGEYAWRKKGTGILPGDANLIIDTTRTTLPKVFKDAGYTTGVVGKWHLGLGDEPIDWNTEIAPGPREVGFDSSFIMPATNDRVPCVYIENGKVVNLDPADPIQVRYDEKIGDEPTGKENPELLKLKPSHGHADTIVNGISRIGFMTGGKAARWVDEEMADVFADQAVKFIDASSEASEKKPFFLFLATTDIHVPRTPNERFVGSSESGIRGDAMHELDWMVGAVMKKLDDAGLAENTLVIFTSDNGPVWDDGYQDGSGEDLNGHQPAGPWRGRKGQPYEAGTRVPMIARWPGKLPPGEADFLLSHADLLASFACYFGQDLPDDSARDSVNIIPALMRQEPEARTYLVEHGSRRSAIRRGPWKLVFDNDFQALAGREGRDGAVELFNLNDDPE